MEAPLLEQWPPSQLSKSTILSSSQDGRSDRATRVEARAEVRAQQEQEHQEREQAQAQMREVLASGLHGAGANIYETDDTDGVIAFDDLIGHLGIADPAVKAQVETILEGMDTDFEASSILMYREGKIYCG